MLASSAFLLRKLYTGKPEGFKWGRPGGGSAGKQELEPWERVLGYAITLVVAAMSLVLIVRSLV